jgi:hypothetical protein
LTKNTIYDRFSNIKDYEMKNVGSCVFFVCVLIVSCTTSGTKVSSVADLSNYHYITISSGTSEIQQQMDMEMDIYEALLNTRFKIIADNVISDLSEQDKPSLLLVKYSVSEGYWESVVSINFVDYLSGRPIASCRGTGKNVLGSGIANKAALKDALSQVSKMGSRE